MCCCSGICGLCESIHALWLYDSVKPIWERLYRLREHQSVWDVGAMVDRASELLREFHDVQKQFLRRSVPSEVVKWSLPVEGLYKVNFDRAIFEDQAFAGLGVMIRDSASLIIGALS